MNVYTYDFELQTMTTMLMNCFSDIVIKRFNANKESRDQIKTRVVYAPKQRVLADLLDKDQNLQLPVMSVQIGGIARDENRTFNKLIGHFYTPSNSTASINEKGPQPIDVTYNISIMTRYQQDMDQILSHLLPYVNPYFVVSWRTPQRPDLEIRSLVTWNGSVNINYPVELNATQVAKVVADLSFTFKGWLFQNKSEHEKIFTIDTNFIPTLDTNLTRAEIEEIADTVTYYGTPPQPKIIYPTAAEAGSLTEVSVWGSGFKDVKNVYLSGSISSATSQNPFALNRKLSADYPAFMGVKLLTSTWTSDSWDMLTFVTPRSVQLGFVDVIIENEGGYGKLTSYARVNQFNPFEEGTEAYTTYIPYQVPYLSGLKIVPN